MTTPTTVFFKIDVLVCFTTVSFQQEAMAMSQCINCPSVCHGKRLFFNQAQLPVRMGKRIQGDDVNMLPHMLPRSTAHWWMSLYREPQTAPYISVDYKVKPLERVDTTFFYCCCSVVQAMFVVSYLRTQNPLKYD